MKNENTKKDLKEWYERVTNQTFDSAEAAVDKGSYDIEKELERETEQSQEQEQPQNPYEDKVLFNEYKNCVQAIGMTEFLKSKLANYLPMTQVADFDSMKKEQDKEEIKRIVDELSKVVAEL